MMPVKTLNQFAAERGLTTTADVDAHIHAGLRSKPTTKTYQRWFDRELARLQRERDATVAAFQAAIAAGEIRAPTYEEGLRAMAAGHPDNQSVQAARRVLAKREARPLRVLGGVP